MPRLDREDPLDLLRQGRDRAAALAGELRRQREELRESSPLLDPAGLAEGRAALDRAVAAAERSLAEIEAALADAGDDGGGAGHHSSEGTSKQP